MLVSIVGGLLCSVVVWCVLDMQRLAQASLRKVEEIQMTLADLKVLVENENTVIGSAVTLLGQLKTDLDAAIAANDPAAIQAVADLLGQGKQQLADAVVANTPAAPVA